MRNIPHFCKYAVIESTSAALKRISNLYAPLTLNFLRSVHNVYAVICVLCNLNIQ